MIHGFLKVAAATNECTVGDCGENTASILALINEAAQQGVSLVVFPELCVTGYTCGDLFSQELLCRVSLAAVRLIAEKTKDLPIASVIGFPFTLRSARYNCAAVISRGKVLGVVPKTHIPNYGEFYELRHFAPAPEKTELIPPGVFGSEAVPFGTKLLFTDERTPDLAFALEICEDLWVPSPPSAAHAKAGALIVANLSASDETVAKADYRRMLVASQSGRAACAYVYADAGGGESSTDMVFAGHNIIAENGTVLAESELFSSGLLAIEVDARRLLHERRRMNTFADETDGYTRIPFAFDGPCETPVADGTGFIRRIDPRPFVPSLESELAKRCEEVFSIQRSGLSKRLAHIGSRSAVLGLSGGLDSTLALLVAVRAFDKLGLDRAGIKAVGMPGFGTTKRTKGNAEKLAAALSVSYEEINIGKAVHQHFKDIGHDAETLDVTYENSQARERTHILMDRANMENGIVIGTGDLSELALGWATYNGDHMSMYAVNASVPKTLVRHLVGYCAAHPESFIGGGETGGETGETPDDRAARRAFSKLLVAILDTPVSPELLPPEDGEISQKTEHIVGPYELHDFFLYYLTRWGASPAKILFLAERAFGDAYDRQEILRWMNVFYRRFFAQQFKRSCLPDGPKVGSVTLSPRSDWRMPSDASSAVWMKELESLG